MTNSIYCKIFIYIHKNLFVPQAQDLLEKLAEILLYNFHREQILLKLKTKKLLRKIKSKNLTAGVCFFFSIIMKCSIETRLGLFIFFVKFHDGQ